MEQSNIKITDDQKLSCFLPQDFKDDQQHFCEISNAKVKCVPCGMMGAKMP